MMGPSDVVYVVHQNCVTLWNKLSTNEDVIVTVILWGVDRLILNPFFQLFVQNFVYFFIFLFMKLTHIQVFKKRMHEARIKCFCLQAPCSFF